MVAVLMWTTVKEGTATPSGIGIARLVQDLQRVQD
jgi:hypothetical protein